MAEIENLREHQKTSDEDLNKDFKQFKTWVADNVVVYPQLSPDQPASSRGQTVSQHPACDPKTTIDIMIYIM